MPDNTTPDTDTEQPIIGGTCETCGHFAGRHNETGCQFPRPAANPCTCKVMRWNATDWPRPWLPAPDGLSPAPTEAATPTP